MDFQIVQKLVDDPLFRYDRNDDSIKFRGNYKEYLYIKQEIVENVSQREKWLLFDKLEDQNHLFEILKKDYQDEEEFYLELSLLTAEEKYEVFSVKGVYCKEQNAIVGILRNIDAIRKADIDPLTGIYNRNGIEKRIPAVLNQTTAESWTALCLVDLDNFKEVNDSKGHLLGDELLKGISAILRETFSQNSLVARIGGDEFLVCYYGFTHREELENKVIRVRDKIAYYGKKEFGVSASIGVATAKHSISYQKLFNRADIALYATKSEGKNSFNFYEPELEKAKYVSTRNESPDIQVVVNGEQKIHKYLLNEILDIINHQYSTKETIEKSAKLITEFFDVTRAYASCYMPDGSRIGKSYFFAQDNHPNIKPKLALHRDEYVKNFNKDGIFFCTDILRANEPIRSELIDMKVESLLQILIYNENGVVIGTFGINNCGKKRLWVQEEIDVMVTISKILTGTLIKLQRECMEEDGNN